MAADPYHHKAWPGTRTAILHRDQHTCQIQDPGCTHAANDVDHIIPWQEGGPWLDPANLRAACEHCNRARGPRRMAQMARLNRQPANNPSRNW